MIIQVLQLGEGVVNLQGREEPSVLELESESGIRSCNLLQYNVFAQIASGELIVRGEITAQFEVQCVQCAEFFSTTVEDSSFLRTYEIGSRVETVDVTPDFREGILLHVPGFPLCHPECVGLCSRCGVNRARNSCDCREVQVDLRWGALDALDVDGKSV